MPECELDPGSSRARADRELHTGSQSPVPDQALSLDTTRDSSLVVAKHSSYTLCGVYLSLESVTSRDNNLLVSNGLCQYSRSSCEFPLTSRPPDGNCVTPVMVTVSAVSVEPRLEVLGHAGGVETDLLRLLKRSLSNAVTKGLSGGAGGSNLEIDSVSQGTGFGKPDSESKTLRLESTVRVTVTGTQAKAAKLPPTPLHSAAAPPPRRLYAALTPPLRCPHAAPRSVHAALTSPPRSCTQRPRLHSTSTPPPRRCTQQQRRLHAASMPPSHRLYGAPMLPHAASMPPSQRLHATPTPP